MRAQVIQVDVEVWDGGREREEHKALKECCNRAEKELIGIKTEVATTIAEAKFMNCILMCQIVPRQVKVHM